jgi:DNA-binding IclR family transcriptional regulator
MRKNSDHRDLASRIIGVLRVLAEGERIMSVTEVSQRLALPPSTVHRLLDHLVDLGMVARAPQRRYRVGTEYFRLGALVSNKLRFVEVAKPLMQEIVRRCNETCQLVLYQSGHRQITVAARIDSPEPLRYRINMHERLPLTFGAIGHAIMAWLDDETVREVIDETLHAEGQRNRALEGRRLEKTLGDVRKRGYAVVRGEFRTQMVVGLAAPFFGMDRQVLGSLCVVAPRFRCNAADEVLIGELLVAQADRLSTLLGRPRGDVPQRLAS